MSTTVDTLDVLLEPPDNLRLASLCGPLGAHLRTLEARFNVEIHQRSHDFRVSGEARAVRTVANLIKDLYQQTEQGELSEDCVHRYSQEAAHAGHGDQAASSPISELILRKARVRAYGANQRGYMTALHESDIVFGIGPAGTGKTYLAVARAVKALEQSEVHRLILVRPVVEAGERLGFLPGDLVQKIDPYLRPMYDALDELMGRERAARQMESHILEIAPLAYMRGRTLHDAFVILDEAQNATREQMKMFLTRIGRGTRVVVTGDLSQSDLPSEGRSGLAHAVRLLADTPGIAVVQFQRCDVLRHPLVQSILDAYGRES